jgi:hypothetical protein
MLGRYPLTAEQFLSRGGSIGKGRTSTSSTSSDTTQSQRKVGCISDPSKPHRSSLVEEVNFLAHAAAQTTFISGKRKRRCVIDWSHGDGHNLAVDAEHRTRKTAAGSESVVRY